jgi:hypothetical protein
MNNCKICNKNYTSYQSLSNHIRITHKNNLQKINIQNSCKYCNKILSRSDSLLRHIKICKIKKEIEINNLVNIKSKCVKNITNNNNNNIIQIINNFKNDNIKYISDKFIINMFKCLENKNNFKIPIPRLIENIKFNPNHKENNNVKITNMRSDIGYKYDNNKWKRVDKDELLNELSQIGAEIFMSFYKEKHDNLSEDIKKCFEEFKSTYNSFKLQDDIKHKIQKIAYIYTKNIELDD